MALRYLTRRLERLVVWLRGTRNDADIRSEFDAAFYLERNRHVGDSGVDPLRHYLETGWKEGADPAAWFSSAAYLAAYEDVRNDGVNPFAHYIRHGRREGRTAGIRAASEASPRGTECGALVASDPSTLSRTAETVAPHFDEAFYLAENPDVSAAGADPLHHYVTEGWREGRDPAPDFSTSYYLETNPDVREQGVNPFWHYIVAGREEHRLPAEPGGYKVQLLKTLPSFARTVEEWRAKPSPYKSVDGDALAVALRSVIETRTGRLVVSFTQDNYREVVGGVQLCAAREEAAALAADHCYLSLHPAQPLPCLASPEDACRLAVNVLLDGRPLGTAPIDQVAAAIHRARPTAAATSLVVHSLLGHAPEAIAAMAEAVRPTDAWFWLHDNFSLCPSYALQRNGISYCGAPSPSSQACNICVYGEERRSHLPRVRALLNAVDFTIVAPSRAERDLWLARSGFTPNRIVVLPHLSLDWSSATAPVEIEDTLPVQVGFAGIASTIKGWPVFRRLAESCAGSGDYTFHYFGVDDPDTAAVAATQVSVSGAQPTAMRDALMARNVDLLVHWSACPETFSFSAHEALAAGAAIVTHAGTGNVAALVRETGRGVLLENEEALLAFFASGNARALAETNLRTTRRGATLVLSRMTIDLIEGERTNGDPLLYELHV